MGKSESGPDMQDCAMYAHQVRENYGCDTVVMLELAGSDIAPRWQISVVSVFPVTEPGKAGAGSTTRLMWPSNRHRTFGAALFCALAEHDGELTRRHFQEILEIA